MHHDRRLLPAVVYKITNLINGKFYIGVTTNSPKRRLGEHIAAAFSAKSHQGAFQRAIRKYGRDAFAIEVLVECETAIVALQEEVRLIAELHPAYNSTKGGETSAGRTLTPEAREKMGRPHKGKPGTMLGKTHAPETVARLRELAIGRRDLFATFAHLGPKASARPVVCLDDGREFESASAAAKHYALSKSAVVEVCCRNPRRAQAGGRVFRYIDDVFDAAVELETAKKRTAEKTHAMRRARGQVI